MLRIRTLRPIFISILGLRCSQMAFWFLSIPYLMVAYGLTTQCRFVYHPDKLGPNPWLSSDGAISDRIGNARQIRTFSNLAYLCFVVLFIVVARLNHR